MKINPEWCTVEGCFDIKKNRHYESVFSLGTGYLITRSSIDEGFMNDDQSVEFERHMENVTLEKSRDTKSRWGTFMPVIQGHHPFLGVELVNLPYFLGFVIRADGEKLDMETSDISDYSRWLDLRTATLKRTLTWSTKSGKRLRLDFSRFMNPDEKFACLQHCQIQSIYGTAEIQVESFVDSDVRTNGYDKFVRHKTGQESDIIYTDVTTNLSNRIVTATGLRLAGAVGYNVIDCRRRIGIQAAVRIGESESVEVVKASYVAADAYFPLAELVSQSTLKVKELLGMSFKSLYLEHCNAWQKRWDACDIQIKAVDAPGYNSQLAIRTALYHLIKSKAPDEARALLCPKGCTSETYFGSVFWDMDIFINPFYIYTFPDIGRTTPMFRYRNLPAAREIARGLNYPGARYPWQSAFNGEETCTLWQYADHQVHITADVAIGVWHYYAASGDLDFLFDYGAEILVETARYWTARVDKVPGLPGYQIFGVMGPDEYKPLTNNNAYTNFTARFNIDIALKVIGMMKKQAPEKYQQLVQRIDLKEEELLLFLEIVSGISIPMDRSRNLIWQCDNYDTAFAPIDIEGIWKDRTRLFGSYLSQEKCYRSKCMKQSDVIALLGVFPEAFSKEQKESSFDYYAHYNIHDSSNSMCHHQIVAANIGRSELAYESWLKSIDIDFGKLPRSSDGIHMANVGGMWQEIVFGFSGLVSALNTEIISFNPCLPREIRRICYQIQWKGKRVAVTVTSSTVQLENLSGADIPFVVKGESYFVKAHDKAEVTYS